LFCGVGSANRQRKPESGASTLLCMYVRVCGDVALCWVGSHPILLQPPSLPTHPPHPLRVLTCRCLAHPTSEPRNVPQLFCALCGIMRRTDITESRRCHFTFLSFFSSRHPKHTRESTFVWSVSPSPSPPLHLTSSFSPSVLLPSIPRSPSSSLPLCFCIYLFV
jgi:hypothetical protein